MKLIVRRLGVSLLSDVFGEVWVFGAAFVLALCSLIFFVPFQGTSWIAETSSGAPGVTVVTSGTYISYVTSVNQQGQTLIYQATTSGSYSYATTTATSTGNPLVAWLKLIVGGGYTVTDPSGQSVEGGGLYGLYNPKGTPDSLNVAANYEVQGQGVDWSSLKVTCRLGGTTQQPAIADDPTMTRIVNAVPVVKEWQLSSQKATLTHAEKIDSLIGGKSWDHKKVLTAGVAFSCSATANVAQGYSYSLNGTPSNTITLVMDSPVVGQTTMSWACLSGQTMDANGDCVTPSQPPTPSTPRPASSPSTTYSNNAAQNTATQTCPAGYTWTAGTTTSGGIFGGGGTTAGKCTLARERTTTTTTHTDCPSCGSSYKSPYENAKISTIGGHYGLLGLTPLIEVYGPADLEIQTSGADTIIVLCFVVVVVGVAGILVSNKRARQRLQDIF